MEDFFLNTANDQIPRNLTTRILARENPIVFHRSLPHYKPTPLHTLSGLADKYGLEAIYLKDESHRLGLNAFKVLGASFAVHKISEQKPETTVFCTATDGNHGKAVAWSASLKGKDSVIYVPKNTTAERIENIKKEGATVIKTRENYDETCQIARQNAEKNGWMLIQDTAWEGYEEIPAYIMTGYLTQFQEIENQLQKQNNPKIDLVMLQAGVGSWAAAGIWHFLNQHKENRPKLVIVEPYESDGVLSSFKAGKRVIPTGNSDTIMAGLNCGIPSLNAWEIIKNCADASLKIKDNYAKEVMRELYTPSAGDPQIISGESGAAGLAGLKYLITEPKAEVLRKHLEITSSTKALAISTEGATDKEMFNNIIKNASPHR